MMYITMLCNLFKCEPINIVAVVVVIKNKLLSVLKNEDSFIEFSRMM